MKTTGFHNAASIPVGATLTRVYFCEPGIGVPAARGEHDTHRDALAVAIETKKAALAAARDSLLPETITIDVRWDMTFPAGGSTDAIAERFFYESLLDAQNHLDRFLGSQAAPTFA